jgi:hypothetical protein
MPSGERENGVGCDYRRQIAKIVSAIMASHFVKEFCAAGASGMDEFLCLLVG